MQGIQNVRNEVTETYFGGNDILEGMMFQNSKKINCSNFGSLGLSEVVGRLGLGTVLGIGMGKELARVGMGGDLE